MVCGGLSRARKIGLGFVIMLVSICQHAQSTLGGIVRLSVLLSWLEKANLPKKFNFSFGHSFSTGAKFWRMLRMTIRGMLG